MESEILARLFDQNEIVLVVARQTIAAATVLIASCEQCSEPDAETLLETVFDEVTGQDKTRTSYVLSEPMFCPACYREIKEGGLVARHGGIEIEAPITA